MLRDAEASYVLLLRTLPGCEVDRDAEMHPVAEVGLWLLRSPQMLRAEAVCSEVLRSEALRSQVLRSETLCSDLLRSEALRSEVLQARLRADVRSVQSV